MTDGALAQSITGPKDRQPMPPSLAPVPPQKPAPAVKDKSQPGQTAVKPPEPAAPSLDDLFAQLKAAKSEEEAKVVQIMIDVTLLQSGSDTIDLLMFRALSAVQNQQMPLAFDLLDTVIALKPDYAEGWNKRASLYFMKRDYGHSISDLEMVLRLQPRHYGALIGLATMLKELGDNKHALEALKRVIAIYPLNAGVIKELKSMQMAVDGRDL